MNFLLEIRGINLGTDFLPKKFLSISLKFFLKKKRKDFSQQKKREKIQQDSCEKKTQIEKLLKAFPSSKLKKIEIRQEQLHSIKTSMKLCLVKFYL